MKINFSLTREDFQEFTQASVSKGFRTFYLVMFIWGLVVLASSLVNVFVGYESRNVLPGLFFGLFSIVFGSNYFPEAKWKKPFNLAIWVLVLVVAAKSIGLLSQSGTTYLISLLVPIAMFVGLWYLLLKRFGGKNWTLALMEKQAGKQLYPQEVLVEFDSEHLVWTAFGTETKVKFENFSKFKETECWLLLYSGAGVFAIPKLKSEPKEGLNELLSIVKNRVKPA